MDLLSIEQQAEEGATEKRRPTSRAAIVVNTATIMTLLGVLWNVYAAKESVINEGRSAREAMAEESRAADKELLSRMADADSKLTQELTRVATKMENVSGNLADMRVDVTLNASQIRNVLDRIARMEAKIEFLEKGVHK